MAGGTPILIVEDDADIARMLGYVLKRMGFDPVVISDGREAAVHVASQTPPAAVLLDEVLPHRDGFSLAAAIRADARWSKVPILMLTARDVGSGEEEARALGISDFVLKPFHPGKLVGRIRALVSSHLH